MAGFSQAEWKKLTTWRGRDPSAAQALDILEGVHVGDFEDAVQDEAGNRKLLQAGHAQRLRADPAIGSDVQTLRNAMRSELGYCPTETTLEGLLRLRMTTTAWNNRFANLVSGRFTELLFERAYEQRLREVGLALVDATTHRTFIDYTIEGARFELSINVKNAGVQYEKAAEHVGLDPEDTIPMATYKTFGALDADIAPLLYVYMVDWSLLASLRAAYWNALSEAERVAFRLFTSFRGLGRSLEDAFIEETVGVRVDRLRKDVGYRLMPHHRFRCVSAARCARLFYENHRRSPYVYQRRMDTDPNVHLSVQADTIPFTLVLEEHLSTPARRRKLLGGLGATTTMRIPDPPL